MRLLHFCNPTHNEEKKINEICFTYKTSLPSTQKQPKLLNLHSFSSLMKNCNSFLYGLMLRSILIVVNTIIIHWS